MISLYKFMLGDNFGTSQKSTHMSNANSKLDSANSNTPNIILPL